MAQDETRHVLTALTPDDRTALFEELPANVLQGLLNLLSDKDRKQALSLLSYPKDSVGRLMTNRYVYAREEWTVARTLEQIRAMGNDSETVMMIYIIDERGVLVDDLLLRKLILADPETPISSLMDRQYVALHSLQDREEAVMVFKKYDLYALPVVDSEGVLLNRHERRHPRRLRRRGYRRHPQGRGHHAFERRLSQNFAFRAVP